MKVKNILLLTLVLSACGSSDSDKTHQAVIKTIKSSLGDPDSYEPVEWDTVKPVYLERIYTDEMIALRDSMEYLTKYMDSILHSQDGPGHLRRYDSIKKIRMKIQTDYIAGMDGVDSSVIKYYKISHKYRAKNKYGAPQLFTETFRLNKTLDTAYAKQRDNEN